MHLKHTLRQQSPSIAPSIADLRRQSLRREEPNAAASTANWPRWKAKSFDGAVSPR
jgi:hypothetical protein